MATAVRYIEELNGMFMSGGWREHFIPRMKALRQEAIEALCYDVEGMDEVHGCRKAIRILDDIIGLEKEVSKLRQQIEANPEMATERLDTSVVES